MKFIFDMIFILSAVTLFFRCGDDSVPENKRKVNSDTGITNVIKYTKVDEIQLPEGFIRTEEDENSFGSYLRNFPLKTDDNKVYLYNGKMKSNQNIHFAVLDLDIGDKDLQQCADAIIRLRAEYLFWNNRFDEIHFNFVSGDNATWNKYKEGYRAAVNRNKVNWVKNAQCDTSYENFRKYLELVFTYSGTASLIKELEKVENINEIEIGDVFIQTGNPYGHAIMVMDIAEEKISGKKIFLLGQSYMPAQNFHILKNPNDDKLSPWYSIEFEDELVTPEWTFESGNLRRFR